MEAEDEQHSSQNAASTSTHDQRFPKRCNSSSHEEAVLKFPKLSEDIFKISNTRKFKGAGKTLITANKWIQENRNNKAPSICGSCLALAESLSSETPAANSSSPPEKAPCVENVHHELVLQVIKLMQSGLVCEADLCQLSEELGRAARCNFKKMASNTVAKTKSTLISCTYSDIWRNNFNPLFRSFASGVCELTSCSLEKKIQVERHLVLASQNICTALNERFISPLAVAENIVLHSFSGSRTASQLFSAVHPTGSYKYLESFVDEISKNKPTLPDGDIYIAFDNQQIVGKEFRVSVAGKQRTSTVTSLIAITEDTNLKLQFLVDIPTDLNLKETNRETLWMKYIQFKNNAKQIHNQYRENWISTRLQKVLEEERFKGLDDPDFKKALQMRQYEDGLSYNRVPKTTSSCKVWDMENLMINPNSYSKVDSVLNEILDMSNSSSPHRKWIPVYCDGVPYNMATNIVSNTYFCTFCNVSSMNLKCKNQEGHTPQRKYAKIVMRPGAGHIEMNLVRSIFSAYFDIFIQPIAIILGFTTPRALEYCKKALDHHKSWQILQIVYLSLTDELIYQFSKVAAQTGTDPSVKSFGQWIIDVDCPNIRMAGDFVFNVLHPLFLYRAGIRQCNEEVAAAGLHKTSPVFYGFNHPKYRQLIARDCFYVLTLPSSGASPAKRSSFCKTRSETGQGPDFILEESNSLQKHWIFSHGTPTEEQWKRTSATLSYFEELKAKVLIELSISGETWKPSHIPLGDAYYEARLHYRSILETRSMNLTTFTANPVILPLKFLNCVFCCEENREKYFQAFLNEERCQLNLIDTTDLDALSIEELTKRSAHKIRQLNGEIKEDLLRKQKICKTKEDFIEIIGETEEEICRIDYSFLNN